MQCISVGNQLPKSLAILQSRKRERERWREGEKRDTERSWYNVIDGEIEKIVESFKVICYVNTNGKTSMKNKTLYYVKVEHQALWF